MGTQRQQVHPDSSALHNLTLPSGSQFTLAIPRASSFRPPAFSVEQSIARSIANREAYKAKNTLDTAAAKKQTTRTNLEGSATRFKALTDPNSQLSAINVARTRLATMYNKAKGLVPRPASPK